jgi:ElaB/YqjD/DUF883 family membrane-anchored ribosome-binding protein
VLRLTLLAPDVVEAILDGRQPPERTLALMMRPFAVTWTEPPNWGNKMSNPKRIGLEGTIKAYAGCGLAGFRPLGAGPGNPLATSGVRSASDFASEQSEAAAAGVRRGAETVGDTFSSAAQSVRGTTSGTTQAVRETASGAAESMKETARGVREQVAGTAEQLKRSAQDVAENLQQYSATIGEQVAETAAQTRRQASRTARQLKKQATSFVHEQPLLCAAIGVALGAALAAALPKTETEDELMGETSDALKHKLGEAASEQLETAKAAASKVAQQAMTSAAREGLTAFGTAEAAGGLADKVRRVVTETASAGASEIRERLDKQS